MLHLISRDIKAIARRTLGEIFPPPPSQPVLADALAQLLSDLHP
jgi:hypothetical protein